MSPPRLQLGEQTWFIRDSETDPSIKDSLLATYLEGSWNRLQIVRIDRIEIGDAGRQATYRTKKCQCSFYIVRLPVCASHSRFPHKSLSPFFPMQE